MTIVERAKTVTFISWAPLLLYLMTNLTNSSWSADLFGLDFKFGTAFYPYYKKNYGGIQILAIYFLYLACLLYFVPKIEVAIKKKVRQNDLPIFYGVILSLVLLIATFKLKRFDLLLKLGCLWAVAIIQWYLQKENKSQFHR